MADVAGARGDRAGPVVRADVETASGSDMDPASVNRKTECIGW